MTPSKGIFGGPKKEDRGLGSLGPQRAKRSVFECQFDDDEDDVDSLFVDDTTVPQRAESQVVPGPPPGFGSMSRPSQPNVVQQTAKPAGLPTTIPTIGTAYVLPPQGGKMAESSSVFPPPDPVFVPPDPVFVPPGLVGYEGSQTMGLKRPFSAAVEPPSADVSVLSDHVTVTSFKTKNTVSTADTTKTPSSQDSFPLPLGAAWDQPLPPFPSAPIPPPTKYTTVPKSELHALYGKAPRRKVISSENYHTWHDAGQAHMLRWTSVFVCPMSGELFPSGHYDGAEPVVVDQFLWYTKKGHAEHAAASRAHDCQAFRDRSDKRIGNESPYGEDRAVFDLPGIGDSLRTTIRRQQLEIRRTNGLGFPE